ncbi:MAG: lectin-like domain-containing protein [Candidatus Marivariicella sp.]
MKKLLLLLFIVLFSCSKDTPPSFLVTISSSVGGSVDTTGGEYGEGATVTVRATADAEYEFVSWSNGSTDNPLVLTVSSNQTITATFQKKKYRLSVVAKGNGSVKEELVSAGRGDYSSGSVVKLTAVPDTGYYFTGWSGDVTGTDNPIDVTVGSEKEITATFEILVLDLEVIVKGEGQVSQAIVEGTGAENENRSTVTQYEYGTIVELTPTPSDGMAFISWSGDYLGEEDPLQLTMTESTSIQANFDYELLIKVVGKWKIKKKTQDRSRWSLYSIIFKRNYSYTINTSRGQVRGSFKVKSNSEIDLVGYGSLSNVDLTKNTTTNTWGNFRFRITVPGEVEEEEVATEVDNNYKPVVNEETGETVERTYVPDDNFEQTLIDLGYDDTLDDYVNTENIKTIENLDVSEKNITDLTGVEDFLDLKDLNLNENNISSLDLSNNINLFRLNADNNEITSLDVKSSSGLNYLSVINGKLKSLDISSNISLEELVLDNNDLISVDLSKNIDLKKLSLNSNKLTSIDLSKNIQLTNLKLNDLDLKSIDLSFNTKIKDLRLENNNLDLIDLSNQKSLEYLSLAYNNLLIINLSNNTKLINLDVVSNQLISLDLSNNKDLIELSTENNNFYCVRVNSDQLIISSNWTKDDKANFSLECINCETSYTVTSGSLNQTIIQGSQIIPITIKQKIKSGCDNPVFSFIFKDQIPGISMSNFSDQGFINNTNTAISVLQGKPSFEGVYNYSIISDVVFDKSTNANNISSTLTISGTITVLEPSLSLSLSTGSLAQTVTRTYAISPIQYTLDTNYSGAIEVNATNLPSGVSASITNNVLSLTGTSTTEGTYDYSVTVSAGSVNKSFSGTIIVSPYNCITNLNTSDFILVSDATISGNEVTLTPAQSGKKGMIWTKNKIDLDEDFSIEADLYLGNLNGNGADGMAFVLQRISNTQDGGDGTNIGLGNISESFAVEFDTYRGTGDPTTNDHIAIIKDGDVRSSNAHSAYASYVDVGNIEDGNNHRTIINWVASSKKFSVSFDGTVIFDLTIDIPDIFFNGDSEVYWGFTAATGALVNTQKVSFVEFCPPLN